MMSYSEMSGCGLAGFINRDGKRVSGKDIFDSITSMKERGNGMGAGYAAYGIYPDMAEYYAFHVMMDSMDIATEITAVLNRFFHIVKSEMIPTKSVPSLYKKTTPPVFYRYFVTPREDVKLPLETEEDMVVRAVMTINENVKGAYVISSGKNMGAFKGVGEPDEIGEFFEIDQYEGYIWIAHTRFPTNTPGWWGGAHPFTLLDWSIVHNGEITSYGTNKRYVEMYGYKCTLLTDTEVAAYIFDLLFRKHKLPIKATLMAIAAPFWKDIEYLKEKKLNKVAEMAKKIREIYSSAMLNGPFAMLFAYKDGLIGFNDRIKLRPFVAAINGDTVYMASEESAIKVICKNPEKVWMPRAGEPVIALMNYCKDGICHPG
ncbi:MULTISPECIES: class II glutamine amidotransferase [unclassified Desulfurobacterium]|uniref:class II glutamine amidotransferase n=1 Tax=Desulfurobacterium sp. TC5-1 TaxID=1158318 RepID=UPI0003B450B8|nr:glutamine amidotransferase family protein [Desulfurobacterium sp. TC5-1]